MGFEIIHEDATQAPNGAITSDRRVFLAEDHKTLVEEGDEAARIQLAAPGHQIPASEVKRLGLRLHKGRVVQGEDEPKQREPAEDKQRKPDENKGGKK